MGKNITSQRVSKIPILSIKKRNFQETKKLSYLESKKVSNISVVRNTIMTKNKTDLSPRLPMAEIQQSPVQQFLQRSVRPDLPLCDIDKSVPITPRKTRSGKVFSRTSHFFGSMKRSVPRSESPISIGGAVTSTPICVPTLPSALMDGLMTAEEIDRTIDEVPNLDDINEPISLFDFADAMRDSLSPEIEKLSLDGRPDSGNKENEAKTELQSSKTQTKENMDKMETDDCMKEIEKAFSMPHFADTSILKPMPVFAAFSGFKPLLADSPMRKPESEGDITVLQDPNEENQNSQKLTDQMTKEEDNPDPKELNNGLLDKKSQCVLEISEESSLSNMESMPEKPDSIEQNSDDICTCVKEKIEELVIVVELAEENRMAREGEGKVAFDDICVPESTDDIRSESPEIKEVLLDDKPTPELNDNVQSESPEVNEEVLPNDNLAFELIKDAQSESPEVNEEVLPDDNPIPDSTDCLQPLPPKVDENTKMDTTNAFEITKPESKSIEDEKNTPIEPIDENCLKELQNPEETSKTEVNSEVSTEAQIPIQKRQQNTRGRKTKTKVDNSKLPEPKKKSLSPNAESSMMTRRPRRKTFFHQLPNATVGNKVEENSNSGNEENQEYSKRSKRRNSIFPHQAIKRISAMHDDLDISTSPTANSPTESVKIIPIEVEEQENQNEDNITSSNCANPEPPISKKRRSARFLKKKISPKKKEPTTTIIDITKPSTPEPMEEDQTIAPVPSRFVVDGKVMVSMVLPKDNRGKRKKVPGIPQTIEIDPTLLVEPQASCMKKDKESNWTCQKYFRWADTKNEGNLEIVKEFTNEYQLRQSTYRKSFFKMEG